MSLLSLFVVANIVNVIMSTIKTLVTVNANKYVAAIVSAVNYGFNVYIVVLTVCELPLIEKCLVVGFCNLVGVFVVKWVEEKARKAKLWEIKLTVPTAHLKEIDAKLEKVPHNYIELSDKHTVFTFYCATKEDTKKVKRIADKYEAKYFVTEGIDL